MTEPSTPIDGTPFSAIPSRDLFLRDEGLDAYQIEPFKFLVDDTDGILHVDCHAGLVTVTIMFGAKSWGEQVGQPITIEGVRYSVVLRSEPVPLVSFDLSKTTFSLSVGNMDKRMKRSSFDFPTPVEETDSVFDEINNGFAALSREAFRKIASNYPELSQGFRDAVAEFEIKRLSDIQCFEKKAISKRAKTIRGYEEMVSRNRKSKS